MFELDGLLYDFVKDVAKYLEWTEEDKLVDVKWPEYSGFTAKVAESGKAVFESRP